MVWRPPWAREKRLSEAPQAVSTSRVTSNEQGRVKNTLLLMFCPALLIQEGAMGHPAHTLLKAPLFFLLLSRAPPRQADSVFLLSRGRISSMAAPFLFARPSGFLRAPPCARPSGGRKRP